MAVLEGAFVSACGEVGEDVAHLAADSAADLAGVLFVDPLGEPGLVTDGYFSCGGCCGGFFVVLGASES
jgi:hypothetical protein